MALFKSDDEEPKSRVVEVGPAPVAEPDWKTMLGELASSVLNGATHGYGHASSLAGLALERIRLAK